MKNNYVPSGGTDLFQSLQPSTDNYESNVKNLSKMLQSFFNPLFKKREQPDIIPANGHDISNYVARFGLTNYQIQSVLKLDGNVDSDRMKKAVRLSIDAEPVLGCRFIESDPPYWKRRNNIDEIAYYSFEETDDIEKAIMNFLKSPLSMDQDTMVKVRLIRSGPSDALCIKINHACADGAGAKEYLKLVSDIYTRLGEDSNYIPKPSKRTHHDQDQIFKQLGINPMLTIGLMPKSSIPMWRFPWRKGSRKKTEFVVCSLPYGQLEQLSSYAKARGATINDLILTAYFRALFKLSKPLYFVPIEIPVTVDLRRYLPNHKAEAIRNLSGGIEPQLSKKPNEAFEQTLSRVVTIMNRLKGQNPGLPNALAAERVEQMSFSQFRDYVKSASKTSDLVSLLSFIPNYSCSPVLSNLGMISNTLLKFGEITVTDAYMLPPVVRDPGLLLLVGTYNGILSLSMGYYKMTVKKQNIEILLNKMKDELLGCTD